MGFFSIVASATGRIDHAVGAIFLAAVFDGLDGRVARLTHTESAFGVEYDSISDAISFGVAPAVLLYQWALAPFAPFGVGFSGRRPLCHLRRTEACPVQRTDQHRRETCLQRASFPGAALMLAATVLFFEDAGTLGGGLGPVPSGDGLLYRASHGLQRKVLELQGNGRPQKRSRSTPWSLRS